MSLIQWEERLSVNVKDIDEQHKKLVYLVNLLHSSMKSGKGKDVLGKILNDLLDYTAYHFKTEENYIQKNNYPAELIHKKEHEALVAKATDIKKRFDKGEAVITIELMGFLKDWLSSHILVSDKKLGEFLNMQGVK